MTLARPTVGYSMRAEEARNRTIEQADAQNLKKQADIEMGQARVILTSPNGTRYAIQVSNVGVLSAVAV